LGQGFKSYKPNIIISEIQFTKHFIEIVFVEGKKLFDSHSNAMFTYGKRADSAQKWMRDANAERWHCILPCELAVRFQYQNEEESEI